ncbi:CBO0543 family protein [Lentibacillus sp. CBA3610]|uniref:CBO0543 family protein n=1 Tax=Lentibacillus sp. CBA3610 TaxID=2518176 RepID=UPI001595A2D7|nr:CBO0543 family protein [Lentibacillus sp. CBA3610]QKY70591.1 hypothetical protein Len3610_14220 [Lentibacillus sp. CBA3610]
MDKVILWFSLILGIALFIFSLRKQPIKNWLLSFLLTAYFANIIGKIVVDLNLIKYPKLSNNFDTGNLYEIFLFPVIGIYFYQTSYRSNLSGIIFQCALYTLGLTISEIILLKYTHLIEFVNWHWTYTPLSIFCFMLAIRLLLELINRKNE